MKKFTFKITLLLLMITSLIAKSQTFNKTFGDFTSYNSFADITEVNSNNFLVVGNTDKFGAGLNDILLFNIDSNANILWQKTLGRPEQDWGKSLKPLSDGNFLLIGSGGFNQTGTDLIIKINSNGDTLWSKGFAGFINSCIESVDGGLVFAGDITNDFGLLFKLSSSGSLLWSKKFSDGNTCMTLFRDVVETSDGGLLIAGITCANTIGQYDVLVIKTDANGNVQWRKLYGGTQGEAVGKVIINTDGNFVICGSTSSYGSGNESAFMLCLDGSGNILWNKLYGNTTDYTTFSKIINSSDGGYIAIGHTWGDIASAFVVKTNISGDTIWTKRYGCDSDGKSIIQSSDGKIYICNALLAPDNTYELGNIIKTDNNGDVFGNILNPNFTNTIITSNLFGTATTLVDGITNGNATTAQVIYGSASIILNDNIMFKSPIFKQDLTCYGANDGYAYLSNCSISNTYIWSNTLTTPLIDNLSPNTYYVTVSDHFGNSYIDSVIISEPALLQDTVRKYICDGDSYSFNGHIYSTTGFYNDTLIAISGCDSIIVTHLITVIPGTVVTDTINKIIHDGINCRDYSIVKISNQWWMSENVSSMKYSDGAIIPNIQSASIWANTTTPAVSNYDTLISNKHYSGTLYNWYAIDTTYNGNKNVCPLNWHIPSDLEWHDLILYIDPTATLTSVESNTAGGKLKQTGTDFWLSPNTGASNELGFNAISTANKFIDGNLINFGTYSYWWTSTPFNQFAGINRSLTYNTTNFSRGTGSLKIGMSVRCIRNADLEIASSITNVNCFGFSTGSIDITVTGGTPPYSYLWSNSAITEDLTNIPAGTYNVTVTDAASSNITMELIVYQQNQLGASNTSRTDVACFGGNNGGATIYVYGGTSPYSVLWPSGQTTVSDTNLYAGTYLITITDANSCNYEKTVVITEPAKLTTSIYKSAASCNPVTNGSIELVTNGGVTPYNFDWSTGVVMVELLAWEDVLFSATTGVHYLTITDNNGCTLIDSADIDEIVNIPDANFKNYLINNSLINTNADSEIQCSEASAYSSTIDVSNLNISDLTGIEAFTAITTLYCWNNNLTSLDVSANTALTALNCYTNQLTSIDLSSNTALYGFSCYNNQLTSLDISANTALTDLDCNGNLLTSLDLSSNINLSYLECGNNQISNLDFSTNSALSILSCFNNQLTNLTLNNNFALMTLDCSSNQLLNLKINNGNNINFSYFDATNNPSLSCIEVDNAAWSTANWTNIDTWSSFSENCNPIIITSVISDPTCNGTSTGAIDITATGGTPPYTYLWSNTVTTEDLINIPAGTYYVTVTDAMSETLIDTFYVTDPSAIMIAFSVVTDASCGNSDGMSTCVATGGTGVYTYLWDNSSTSPTLTGVPAGSYSITVTDNQGCSNSNNVILNNIGGPSVSIDYQTNVSCFGGNNGVAALIIFGTGPYTHLWSDGQTIQDAVNLTAGAYTVTVTDANTCVGITSVTVTEPAQLSVSKVVTNVSCAGFASGSIDITPSGGFGTYYYNWSNTSTFQDVSSLVAGVYTLTLTDGNGCSITDVTTITAPAMALTLGLNLTNISCYGANDGSISSTVSGGTSPYSYSWSNSEVTSTISNLPAGTYTLTVTDANGCIKSSMTNTYDPPQMFVNAGTDQNICSGGSVGLSASASGGYNPYTYSWSPSGSLSNPNIQNPISSATANEMYVVTVTDATSCSLSDTVYVGVTPAITVNAGTDQTVSTTNVNLSGSVSGGTSTGVWTTSGGGAFTPDNTTLSAVYILSAGDVAAGTVTLTLTSSNNGACNPVADNLVIIYNVSTLSASITTQTNVSCNGGSNGTATASPNGGTTPYSYLWSNGQTTQTATNLTVGTYTITVTDATFATTTVSVTITEPTILTASTTKIDANCGNADGSATVTAIGGTSPYTYIWSNSTTTSTINSVLANTYTVTVTDANVCTTITSVTINNIGGPIASINGQSNVNCFGGSDGTATASATGGITPYTYLWSNGQTTAIATSLNSGGSPYTVTVTAANGCNSTASVTITQPSQVSASTSSTDVLCYGTSTGTATVIASGGTTPYTYLWSNSFTSSNLAGLISGGYNVTVTDANGCFATSSATINQPAYLSMMISSLTPETGAGNCDGAMSVYASGGISPYTFLWNPSVSTSDVATGLCAGDYYVTVTDVNGCTATINDTITTNISQVPVADFSASQTTICGAGSVSFTDISTGNPTSWSWNFGNGNTSVLQNPTAIYSFPGVYTVSLTVTNSFGSDLITKTDFITVAPNPSVSVTTTNVDCFGASTGSATASVSSGTPPFNYNWDNGSNLQVISSLISGSYTVIVTDANGCIGTSAGSVSEPDSLSASFSSQTNVMCYGQSTGAATLSVSGGTGTYSYLWSNGSTTASITSVPAASYTVTINDANLCQATAYITISEPSAPIGVTAIISDVTTSGGSDGSIDVTVIGGTSPYTFSWSTSAISEDLANIPAGIYYLSVFDDYSCQFDTSFEVLEPASIISVASNITNVSCFGLSDGSIDITPTGGQTPYSYVWSNGGTTATLSALSSGVYIVTVTDANSETLIKTFTITEPLELIASISSQTDVSCFGLDDGSLISSVTGGTTPYNYAWSDAQTSDIANNLTAGNYGLTVSDANLCESVISATIVEPTEVLLSSTITDVSCGGTSDGAIDVTVTGGTTPYTFIWSNGSSTEDLTNLAVGNYSITVQDANLCELTQNFIISSGANIIVVDSVKNVSCYGANDGSISLNISGGNPPFTINWSNGSTSNALSGLAPGTYSVTISDNSPCDRTISYNITQPISAITATSVSTTVADCNYSCTGTANLTISGGTIPYSYLWSGGQTTNPAQNLCPGMNTVTITDANGCFKEYSVQINIEPLSKIKGNIYYSGILMPIDAAIVELWKETTSNNSGKLKVGELHNVANGYYEFSGLPSGTYYVKAKVLNQGDFPNTLPTWYDTAHQWFNATPIILGCNVAQNININMLMVPAMANGNTHIHGQVTMATFNKSILGEPIPGAELTLEQEPDDEPIISTTTGSNGTYDFFNIPDANYIVVVDIPGYTQFETYNITVNSEDTIITNINFVVDTTDVGLGIYVNHEIFVPMVDGRTLTVNVFPNPFTKNVNIEFDLEESANISVNILDVLGKDIYNICQGEQTQGKHNYNFEDDLPAGIYFVKISVDNTIYVKKLVKK